ncbi:MAG TPA: hypothetical protein VMZ71_12705, partial [Gemmataceae bacterium]|nr:hypothetical protein [Gemmataceae bacterium]
MSAFTNFAIRPFGPTAQPSPVAEKATLLYFSRSSGFQVAPSSTETSDPEVPTATHRSFAQATPERNGSGFSIRFHVFPPSMVRPKVPFVPLTHATFGLTVDDGYAVVRIARPAPGRWRIQTHEQQQAYVVAAFVTSLLRVRLKLLPQMKHNPELVAEVD